MNPPTSEPGSTSRIGQASWLPRWSRADVHLIGRVGTDTDIRFPGEDSGRGWARIRIATGSPGSTNDEPDWHTVVASGRQAQFVARYVTRRRLVHVSGWLTYRIIGARGDRHKVAEIRASNILLLDKPARVDDRASTAGQA
jgi:single-stranded DNA-binding protein